MTVHFAYSLGETESSLYPRFFSCLSLGFGFLSWSNPLVEEHVWCSCTLDVVKYSVAGCVTLLEVLDCDC